MVVAALPVESLLENGYAFPGRNVDLMRDPVELLEYSPSEISIALNNMGLHFICVGDDVLDYINNDKNVPANPTERSWVRCTNARQEIKLVRANNYERVVGHRRHRYALGEELPDKFNLHPYEIAVVMAAYGFGDFDYDAPIPNVDNGSQMFDIALKPLTFRQRDELFKKARAEFGITLRDWQQFGKVKTWEEDGAGQLGRKFILAYQWMRAQGYTHAQITV